jgi:hypothetical protein
MKTIRVRGKKSAPLRLFSKYLVLYVDKHGWPNRFEVIDGELCVVWDCEMDVVPPKWHGVIKGLEDKP